MKNISIKSVHLNWLFIILAIYCLINLGCVKPIQKIEDIDISDGFTNHKKMNLSEITSEVKYIKLETNSKSIIGRIDKLRLVNNTLYVQDGLANKLFKYDLNGKFILQIGQEGDGPEQYAEITDFEISEELNRLVVFDNTKLKFLFFDLKGKYIGSKRAFNNTNKIARLPKTSNFLLLSPRGFSYNSGGCKFSLIPFDHRNEDLIDFYCSETDLNANLRVSFLDTYIQNDTLHYWESDENKIVQVLPNQEISTKYQIDLGSEGVSKVIESNSKKLDEYIPTYNIVDELVGGHSRYLFFGGIAKGYMRNIVYDKKLKEAYNLRFHLDIKDCGFHNDLDGGFPFWPKGQANSEWLYCNFNGFELKKWLTLDYFKKISIKNLNSKNELEKLLDLAQREDNPIVMLVKIN